MTVNPEFCEVCETDAKVRIIDSGPTKLSGRRRRYKCSGCGERWSTYETKSTEQQDAIRRAIQELNALNTRLKPMAEKANHLVKAIENEVVALRMSTARPSK